MSVLFAFLANSCSQEELFMKQSTSADSLKFTAFFEENESRTYVEEGNLLRWIKGDQISLFVANTLNRQYQFDGETGDNSGTFSIVNSPFGTGNDLNCHYAVYPYSSDIKITEKGVITVTLPAEQSYVVNSFGPGANTMVAVTQNTEDTFLKFKNVGGYLKLQLYGDNVTIKSISLKGNLNEKIAGKATINSGASTISMTTNATETINLNCEKGVKIGSSVETATTFWLVVPPTTFESGFTVNITDINGNSFTKSTSNTIVIERNVIQPMAAFNVAVNSSSTTIPENQIWYTSQNNSIVTPHAPYAFGANIISNVYENGKGIITFDSNITSIGRQAFHNCTSLTSVTIPNSVISIGIQAFSFCTSLTDIAMPNNIKSIGHSAFENCSLLKKIIIPGSITAIEDFTFSNCKSLSNVTIPSSVTTIGVYAFWYCSSLTNIALPNSITTIGEYAFSQCTSLNNITIPNNVTTIEDCTFYNCTSLTEITIPHGVKTINEAFSMCTSLKNVTIPNSVTAINGTFLNCSSLTNITIPNSVATIGAFTFSGCTSLSNITIPNSVITIGQESFKECTSLSNLIIPNSVTTIGKDAFWGCTLLRNLTISNGVTTIGEGAFTACQSLANVTIPNSVTTIGPNIFLYCYLLESVSLSSSCKEMIVPFSECTSLAEIYVPTTTPPIIYDKDNQPEGLVSYNYYAFDSSIYTTCKIYVPKGSVNAYKEAYGWKNFTNIIEAEK